MNPWEQVSGVSESAVEGLGDCGFGSQEFVCLSHTVGVSACVWSRLDLLHPKP